MSTDLLDIYWLRTLLNYLILALAFVLIGLVMHKALAFSRRQTLIGLGVLGLVLLVARLLGLIHLSIL